MLRDLLDQRLEYCMRDGERFFDAVQNARLVANAERYYRVMYYGSRESWNLRDQHMFDTLQALLAFRGPTPRRWSGSTTRTSATPRPPRWARAASSTSASCARGPSATPPISSASAPTTAPSPPRPTGTARWR